MNRVAIIAAMAAELKPLVRGWSRESRNGVSIWRRCHSKGEWIAACAGAGVKAARRAFAEIEKEGEIGCVYSTGWAGALDENHLAGRAYEVSGIIDAASGERVPVGSGECWLVTHSTVADLLEKRRLSADFGASLVDMEAAGVAALARARGIRFFCVKGVSDGFDDKIPDFNRFISPDGQFLMARFALHAIVRPWLWPVLIRMHRNCRDAAQSIGESLLRALDEVEIPKSDSRHES